MKVALPCIALALSCASTPPSAAVSARQLLKDYWNGPDIADTRYRGRIIEVAGIVQGLVRGPDGRLIIQLDVAETGYAVACHMARSAENGAEKLARGQLIAVHGTGAGAPDDRPELADCRVVWSLEPDEHGPSPSVPEAIVAGASVCLCLAADPTTASNYPFGVFQSDRQRIARKLEREARERIESVHASAIPCSHPLISVLERCFTAPPLALPKFADEIPDPAQPTQDPRAECRLGAISLAILEGRPLLTDAWKPDSLPRVLQDLADRYSRARTYQDTGSRDESFESRDGKHARHEEFRTWFVRPSKFRFEWRGAEGGGILVSDEHGTFVYSGRAATVRCKSRQSLKMALAAATPLAFQSIANITGLLGLTNLTGPSLGYDDVSVQRMANQDVITGLDPFTASPVKLLLDPRTGLLAELETLPPAHADETDLAAIQRQSPEKTLADPKVTLSVKEARRRNLESAAMIRKTSSSVEVHRNIRIDDPISDDVFSFRLPGGFQCDGTWQPVDRPLEDLLKPLGE
jgi:outer membrane lipoprotein-sorting protein